MANLKITDLTNYPTVLSSSSDVLAIVDVTNNITKKITVDNLFAGRASSGVGAGGGTVTSLTLIAPQGLLVNGLPSATITTSGIFSLTYSQTAGFIPLTVLATNPQQASANTFLAGDSTWKALPIPSGTVQSVGLAMPSIFQVTTPLVTTSGTLTASWDGLSGGKIPALNLGGTVPSGQPITNFYLRADGTWQPPVGPGIGTVSSLTVTVPSGLLINGGSSATNTSNTPFALTWDTVNTISPYVLGNGTPSNATFLSGTGWVIPPSVSQQNTIIRTLGVLSATAILGSFNIVLTGQYSVLDIPILGVIYFGENASQAYTVSALSAGLLTTTVTLTSALRENHFIGANVYKYAPSSPYTDVILGSNISSAIVDQQLTAQNLQTPASWLTGLLLPIPSQGAVGQYYRVTGNDSIYLKTDTNTWDEQAPFENVIDGRSFSTITNTLGKKIVNGPGQGYTYSYQITVQAVNLNANVVINGFKYITTTGNINSVILNLTPPPTGWTLGNYANLALAMQMAINSFPSAVPVSITNDDSDMVLSVLTSIPNVFTSPNPPTVASLTPTGLQPNSFLSSITVIDSIGGAIAEDSTWNFSTPFSSALTTFTDSVLDTKIGAGSYISTVIQPSGASAPLSTDQTIAVGWSSRNTTTETELIHSGDLRSLLAIGNRVAFATYDYSGYIVQNIAYSGGQTIISLPGLFTKLQPGLTLQSTMYKISSYQAVIPGGDNHVINWNPTTSIPGLTYSNGVFTNTYPRRRVSFSMQINFQMIYSSSLNYPAALITEADIWFAFNNTNPNDPNNRWAQQNWKKSTTATVGRDSLVLSTSWVFSMNQGDTVVCVSFADADYYISPALGAGFGGALDVTEV